MNLKPCIHPDDHRRELMDASHHGTGSWCSVCGALMDGVNGGWRLPATMREPKRFIVASPHELPPHSDRRAWEGFAAAMYPTAVAFIAQSLGSTDPAAAEESAKLAGLMADRLMTEWSNRFAPEAP